MALGRIKHGYAVTRVDRIAALGRAKALAIELSEHRLGRGIALKSLDG
ncbi:hypothetical protein VQH23_26065 (plasmid) [Pararoseomonas sp. SCSIO 73927]